MAVFAVAPLSEACSSWILGYSSEHTTMMLSNGSLHHAAFVRVDRGDCSVILTLVAMM